MCANFMRAIQCHTEILYLLFFILTLIVLYCIVLLLFLSILPFLSCQKTSSATLRRFTTYSRGRIMKANLKLVMNMRSTQPWFSLVYHRSEVDRSNGRNISNSHRDRYIILNCHQLKYAIWSCWTILLPSLTWLFPACRPSNSFISRRLSAVNDSDFWSHTYLLRPY